jgi:hypothetical protein
MRLPPPRRPLLPLCREFASHWLPEAGCFIPLVAVLLLALTSSYTERGRWGEEGKQGRGDILFILRNGERLAPILLLEQPGVLEGDLDGEAFEEGGAEGVDVFFLLQ